MEGTLSPADVAVLSGNNRNSDGMFGDNGWWIILIILLFGYGRNGFGGNGGSGAYDNYVLSSDFATLQRLIQDGNNMLERRTDNIINGLCDGFYTNAQLINGVNTNISNLGFNLQNCCCDIKSQLADCCCTTQRAIDGVNYNLATNTCAITNNATQNTRDIIDAVNCNYRNLHDEIVANRIEDKNAQIQAQQSEINALRLAASQEKQNAYLLSELKTCPVPAYLTCNPNAPLNYSISYGNCGCNNGCGC